MMGNKKGQEITLEGIYFLEVMPCQVSISYHISYWVFLIGCHFPQGFNYQEQEERAGLYITCNNIDKDNKL